LSEELIMPSKEQAEIDFFDFLKIALHEGVDITFKAPSEESCWKYQAIILGESVLGDDLKQLLVGMIYVLFEVALDKSTEE